MNSLLDWLAANIIPVLPKGRTVFFISTPFQAKLEGSEIKNPLLAVARKGIF
jgi:hypothetical protein